MKILYNIAGTYNSGGMERVLANKANWLVENGHEVIIVTTDQRGQKPFFHLDERIKCYDLGINYEVNNGKSFINKLLRYPQKQLKHKKRLIELLNQIKPDITVSMFCNDVSFVWQIKDGSRKVLEVHFSRFKRLQYGRKGFWRLADKWRSGHDVKTVSHFDRFVVLTEEDRTYWGNMPNIRVIPNARTYSCTAPAKLDNKTVLAVGRYNHQKGFERLIEAWGIVCREVPGWQLEIIGDGELRPQMVEQINSLGMQGSIVLKKVPGNQMRETYASASIFVLSSRYEGLPMVLLEAQASGLPIVSFACKCGPRDVIDHGVSGFLVDEGDVETLAARIIQLAKDEELRQRMGLAAHANSNHFSEETIMNRWVELFESL